MDPTGGPPSISPSRHSLGPLQHWAACMQGLGLQLALRRQVAPHQRCTAQHSAAQHSSLNESTCKVMCCTPVDCRAVWHTEQPWQQPLGDLQLEAQQLLIHPWGLPCLCCCMPSASLSNRQGCANRHPSVFPSPVPFLGFTARCCAAHSDMPAASCPCAGGSMGNTVSPPSSTSDRYTSTVVCLLPPFCTVVLSCSAVHTQHRQQQEHQSQLDACWQRLYAVLVLRDKPAWLTAHIGS
jgi:hypothetical protein